MNINYGKFYFQNIGNLLNLSGHNYLKPFAFLLCLICLLTVTIDAYLIQRTYLYFGGGALNRPFALTRPTEYFEYFMYAISYDFFIFGFQRRRVLLLA